MSSDDAVTTMVPEPEDLELLDVDRPRDPVGVRRVVARMQTGLSDKQAAPMVGGRYVLLDVIGSGGLGTVHGGYDPELDRRVAIKVLHARGRSADLARERMLREAKALARLSHPNVVAVHDVGKIGDDLFIAMELVEGPSLSQWVKAEKRPWKRVRDLLVSAGRGLIAAHEAGIVHRDFKPANVLVGGDGRARVLDFGLARRVAGPEPPREEMDAEPESDELTRPGYISGTPGYIAPELVRTEDAPKPSSDQFSFCVTAYVVLYQQKPFAGATYVEMLDAAERGQIRPRPSTSNVPLWLHRVIVRGLSGDPAARFPSLDALLFAMTRDGRARRKQWLLGAAVGLLLGAAAASTPIWPSSEEPAVVEETSALDEIAARARDAAAKAHFIYPALEEKDGATAYKAVLELEALGSTAAFERAVGLRTEFAATLSRLGDRLWERDGGRAFAVDYYASALLFQPANAHAAQRVTLTPGELAAFRERARQGEFSASQRIAGETLAALAEPDESERERKIEKVLASNDGMSSATQERLGRVLGRPVVKKRKRAEPPVSSDAAAVLPAEGRAKSGSDAAGLVRAGTAARRAGKFAEARNAFHRALGIAPRNHRALAGLARTHFDAGEIRKAIPFAKQAVERAPKNAAYRILYGDLLSRVFAYQDAKRQYEKAKKLGHKSASGRLGMLNEKLAG